MKPVLQHAQNAFVQGQHLLVVPLIHVTPLQRRIRLPGGIYIAGGFTEGRCGGQGLDGLIETAKPQCAPAQAHVECPD
jgi:hypothetical protein